MLAGFPVLAQVGAFPPTGPVQEESRPPVEAEPAPVAAPPPAEPASPFGPSPGVLPGIFGGRPEPGGGPAEPASPFGISPDVFPGILGGRPDRRPQGQPAIPSETGEPDTFAAPGGGRLEAAPAPEVAPPFEPEPGFAGAPDLTSPNFLTPPFGFGNPALSPLLGPNPASAAAPTEPPSTTALAPVRPGALPIQANDLRAPPILIQPSVSVFGGYTDNPNGTPNNFSDVFGQFRGGAAVSVDTVRLQGQLNGSVDYLKYARSTDQDRVFGNLLAYGLGTVVMDHLFIDGRAAITDTSRTGGFAFAGPTLIPASQAQQVITTSVTPIARQSFGGYVDSELRYNFSSTQSTSGSFFGGSSVSPLIAPNLQNATQNAGTATFSTGRLFTVFGSKLTLDARKIDSDSLSQSTQLRAFDDLSYQFNPKFSGLARIGYEDLDYPLQPSASFNGPSWYVGGRYTPFGSSYLLLTYGRQQGLLGFNGALQYEITPRTVAFASYQKNRISQQQQNFNNLNSSGVDAYGNVVDQSTGLPISLANTAFGNSNAVSEYQTAQAGVQTRLERDSVSLFGFLAKRTPLVAPVFISTGLAVSDTSGGVNLVWSRSLTPRLNSSAALGVARQTSDDQNTLTASLSLQYIVAERLNAILNYQFINVDSSAVGNSYHRNQVQIGLTRSF